MTKLQRMAGLWRAAQLMYWRGAAQKVTGAIAGCVCVVEGCSKCRARGVDAVWLVEVLLVH
jgi:hypothetical protein